MTSSAFGKVAKMALTVPSWLRSNLRYPLGAGAGVVIARAECVLQQRRETVAIEVSERSSGKRHRVARVWISAVLDTRAHV